MPEGEYYKAINGLMQGSGADVLKSALVRLDQAGLSDYIVVPVRRGVVLDPERARRRGAGGGTLLKTRRGRSP